MTENNSNFDTSIKAKKNNETDVLTQTSPKEASQHPQQVKVAREIIELLEKSSLTEIEYRSGDFRVRAVKGLHQSRLIPTFTQKDSQPVSMPTEQNIAINPSSHVEKLPVVPSQYVITSPMVGTAYLSPKPGDPPFVSIDAEVKEGQTVLIIEAMKTMNTIKAGKSGRVRAILIKNGDPVEFGQSLIHIE